MTEYTKEDCLEALREAADRLGHSPTKDEYRDLGLGPSLWTIRQTIDGSWNDAKREAGLEIYPGPDGRSVAIDETYFETIETDEQAYWLGTLFAHSSQSVSEDQHFITISHPVSRRHYAEGLNDALESEYTIYEYEIGGNQQDRVQLQISNATFLDTLAAHGLDDSAKRVDVVPDLDPSLQPAFLRGYLELRGQLSLGSSLYWRTLSHFERQLDTIANWIEACGVKRTTVNEQQDGRFALNVSSIFDIATLFETCWPNGAETSPAFRPFADTAATDIRENHPYPENLSFGGDGESVDTAGDETSRKTGILTGADGAPSELTDDDRVSEAESFSVDPLVLLLVAGDPIREPSQLPVPWGKVTEAIKERVTTVMESGYSEVPASLSRSDPRREWVAVPIEIPAPSQRILDAIVSDPESPYEAPGEFLTDALYHHAVKNPLATESVSLSGTEDFVQIAVANSDDVSADRYVETELTKFLLNQIRLD